MPDTIGYEPEGHDDMWAFAGSLRSREVRAQLTARGYSRGMVILVGDTTPPPDDTRPMFRVWRDDTVPGGWDGAPGVGGQ